MPVLSSECLVVVLCAYNDFAFTSLGVGNHHIKMRKFMRNDMWQVLSIRIALYNMLIPQIYRSILQFAILLLMGNLLLKKKDTKTAKEYYSKILEFHPDNAVALNNVATTYAENEEYEDALIYYDKSLKADLTYQTAYYGMAACYFNMGEYRKCFDTCHEGVFKMKYHPEDKGINAKFF